MDQFSREGLALDVALSTSAERVIGVLTALVVQHGAPAYLRSDNGAEFVASAVQGWLTLAGLQTLYIDPGKPWQNGILLSMWKGCAGTFAAGIPTLAASRIEHRVTDDLELLISTLARHQAHHHQCSIAATTR